jgi:hypothetical protein
VAAAVAVVDAAGEADDAVGVVGGACGALATA